MNRRQLIIAYLLLCLSVNVGFAQEQPLDEQQYFNRVRTAMKDSPDNTADNAAVQNESKRKSRVDVRAYIRIIVVLSLMIAAIYLIFRFVKKYLHIKDDVGEGVQLLTSRTLGPGKQVQTVYVHGRYLILGVTNDNISLLGEITDPKEIESLELYANEQAAESGQSFRDMISNMYGRLFNKKTKEEKTFNYETDEADFIRRQQDKLSQNIQFAQSDSDMERDDE